MNISYINSTKIIGNYILAKLAENIATYVQNQSIKGVQTRG